jgi:hypothetical protein
MRRQAADLRRATTDYLTARHVHVVDLFDTSSTAPALLTSHQHLFCLLRFLRNSAWLRLVSTSCYVITRVTMTFRRLDSSPWRQLAPTATRRPRPRRSSRLHAQAKCQFFLNYFLRF